MGKNRSDEAIQLAVEGRWEEAIAVNEGIIEVSPGDIEARNRLGKALAELGRNEEARKAYEKVLELDPNNSIAQRNLQRLAYLRDGERPSKKARGVDSRFFIQDTSKARMVDLFKIAPRETLAKMSPGDEVYLKSKGQKLQVTNGFDEYLGQVEPQIGSRLTRLMRGGNEYRAVISSLRDNKVKVVIKETFRHPSQIGHPSFPPAVAEEWNPYLKNSMVKHDIDEDLEELEEPDDWESEFESLEQDEPPPESEVFTSEKGDAGQVV